jgi:asparagine N-glycosylation enzyme membrane subunit Stt3
MKRKIQDERIIQEARKQNSLGFTILYFGVLLDLLYRQFILQEPVSRYWDLALLFFGVTFILAVKRVSSGLLTNKLNLRRNVLSSIIAAVVFSIFNFWWVGNKSAVELIISGIIFCIGFYGINLLMQYFSSKKNDDMLKED